mmetsp:Transcript_33502/g.49592  ORF Transcript_33502/g.49592 Transcript_33502/m.49592 type:complete len:118 (+) Transcript_33502:2471-2824(+)
MACMCKFFLQRRGDATHKIIINPEESKRAYVCGLLEGIKKVSMIIVCVRFSSSLLQQNRWRSGNAIAGIPYVVEFKRGREQAIKTTEQYRKRRRRKRRRTNLCAVCVCISTSISIRR